MINLSSAPEVLQSTAQNHAREAIKFDSQGSRGNAIQSYQKAIESLIKLTKLYPMNLILHYILNMLKDTKNE